jgi:radical SAM superfamily enzyme YgiQ (UPF0313 family)
MASTQPKVLFSNPPWWVSETPCELNWLERVSLRKAGVRAGSRWPYTYKGWSIPGLHAPIDYIPYPFFMGYAATYLSHATGAAVTMRDSIVLRETYASYFRFLAEQKFDFIFIETATPSWAHDKQVIARIRALQPQAVIGVAGPIATVGASVLEEAPIDALIKGEYEKGSLKVVQGARGVIDFDLLTTEEMNAAPFPYFDATIAHRYWDPNPAGQKRPQAQVWSSRGCPYKCIFCVWPAAMTGNDPDGNGKRTVRHYSEDYMLAFLTELVGKYKFKTIYFDDDTFNLGNKHTLAMCRVMERIGLPWSAMCRADTIQLDTWKAMKDSGCFGVKIGFESGNQYVVDQIVNKHLDLEKAHDVVQHIKTLGMSVHGTFTYGLPGETPAQRQETKRFVKRLGLTTKQESGCAEIEGAPLHTLTSSGTLSRYAGAKQDSDYDRQVDGNTKFQKLAAEMSSEE